MPTITTPEVNIANALRALRFIGIGGEIGAEVSRAREKHGPNTGLPLGNGRSESIMNHVRRQTGLDMGFASNAELEEALKAVNDAHTIFEPTTRCLVILEEVVEMIAADSLETVRTEAIQAMAMLADLVVDIDTGAVE